MGIAEKVFKGSQVKGQGPDRMS